MKSKKKFNLFIMLLLTLCLVYPVHAEEVVPVDVTPVEYEQNSSVDSGDDVNFGRNIEGSSLIAGNKVKMAGNVDGVVIEAGSDVKYEGTSLFGLVAGNTIDINGTFEKDALIAGNVITVRDDAKFGRDVYIFGSNVELSGTFSRNVFIYAQQVKIENATVAGNLKINSEETIVKENAVVSGTLTYNSNENNSVSEKATVGNAVVKEVEAPKVSPVHEMGAKIVTYAGLLLVFVVMSLLFHNVFTKTESEEFSFNKIMNFSGIGLLFLILVPMVAVILFTLIIGTPLALLMLCIYIMSIYLSNAFSGYYVGKCVWTKLFKKEDNTLIDGLVGISALFILSLIPVLGAFTSILSVLCGLGLIYNTLKRK